MWTEYDPLSMEPVGKIPRFIDWMGGPLQVIATFITAAGTILVAQTDSYMRFLGFGIWIFSNLLWMWWSTHAPGRGGVLVTYFTNFALNLLGIYNNWPRS